MDLLIPNLTALSSQTTVEGNPSDSQDPCESVVTRTSPGGLCTPSITCTSLNRNLGTAATTSQAIGSSSSAIGLTLGKLASLLLEDGNRDVVPEVQNLLEMSCDPESKTLVALGVADILSRHERVAEALNVLQGVTSLSVSRWLQLWLTSMLVRLNVWLKQFDEAWALTEAQLPEQGYEQPEDIGAFMQWLTGMMELNQWSHWREMKPRLEQFLSQAVLQDPALVLSTLENIYLAYLKSGRTRESVLVQKLALHSVRNLQDPTKMSKDKEPQWRTRNSKGAQTSQSRNPGPINKTASVVSLASVREAHKLARSSQGDE